MSNETKPNKSGLNWGKLFDREDMVDDKGRPNLDAVLRFLAEEGQTFISENFIDIEIIEEALNKVHNTSPDTNFDIDALAITALSHIQVPPNRASKATEQIANFIRAQSRSFKNGSNDALYYLPPGKRSAGNGGVIRITPEFAAKFREKHSKEGQ